MRLYKIAFNLGCRDEGLRSETRDAVYRREEFCANDFSLGNAIETHFVHVHACAALWGDADRHVHGKSGLRDEGATSDHRVHVHIRMPPRADFPYALHRFYASAIALNGFDVLVIERCFCFLALSSVDEGYELLANLCG